MSFALVVHSLQMMVGFAFIFRGGWLVLARDDATAGYARAAFGGVLVLMAAA